MFRRLRWMIIGAVGGLVALAWMRGKANEAKDAVPEAGMEFIASARENLRGIGDRLRDAISEGVQAMSEREEELRREVLGGSNGSRRRG